jgi:hypothetical protein
MESNNEYNGDMGIQQVYPTVLSPYSKHYKRGTTEQSSRAIKKFLPEFIHQPAFFTNHTL